MGKNNYVGWVKLFKRVFVAGCFMAILSLLLYTFQFNDAITKEDEYYAHVLLQKYDIAKPAVFSSYEQEVSFIRRLRNSVIDFAPGYEPIPFNHERNVRDLYEKGSGMCYDKSFVIEKMLRMHGFEVRHVAIYYTHPGYPSFLAVLSKSYSHATLEVKTSKGWMLVDSLTDVIGLDEQRKPLTACAFRDWIQTSKAPEILKDDRHYGKPFICVYGLYSRHGKMFPPYTSIPDYKLRQLLYNVGI